jgi:DNA-binding transcriptional ArsR family regulator
MIKEYFMNDGTLTQLFTIRDLETLKVVSDPMRIQIIEVLIPQALTVKQVADKLGLSPSKLYYHVNLLEKHGLIRVIETHVISNMIEKVYRATSANIEVDKTLLSFVSDEDKPAYHSILTSTVDVTREDILRSLQARQFQLEQGAERHPRSGMIHRTVSRMPASRAIAFQDRLRSLAQEFEEADESQNDSPELPAYALMIACYPSFYYDDPAPQENSNA